MQEKVKIKNSKGQNLSGVIHYADMETEKIAILCPGFLDSKDYNHLVKLAELLSGQGYTVVRFDPTGTWDSEGSISDYSTTQYLKDIKSVKDFMLKEKKYSFILLGGHSMGGRMSLLYSPNDPQISFVLAIMSGYKKAPGKNDDKWKIEGVYTENRDNSGNPNQKTQYVLPFSFLKDSDKYNVLDTIKELHTPILLIAGEKDTLVPPTIMKTIFDNANEPKKLIVVSGIGHDYRHNMEEIKKVNEIILQEL